MKKIYFFVFILMLLGFSTIVSASKQEWMDKNYDFSKANKILVLFNYAASSNGISELEAEDIFSQKMREISAKLQRTGRCLYGWGDVINELEKNNNVKWEEMEEKDPKKASEMFRNYVLNNFDLAVEVNVLAYDVGSQYYEGYFINMPSTTTSFVNTPYGSGMVTTYGTTPQYVRGGNVPVIYGCVRFSAYSLPQGAPVWNRIDDRAKPNQTVLENTKPKDVYTRIINNWTSEFTKKLKIGTN